MRAQFFRFLRAEFFSSPENGPQKKPWPLLSPDLWLLAPIGIGRGRYRWVSSCLNKDLYIFICVGVPPFEGTPFLVVAKGNQKESHYFWGTLQKKTHPEMPFPF